MDFIILLALVGMTLGGLADFLLKKGVVAGTDINVLFFYSFLLAAIAFGILCLIKSAPLTLESPLPGYSLLIASLIFIGSFAFLSALKKGDASIVVPIGRMGFVVTAICAFIFLGETLSLLKGLGIFFAILAILLLSKK